jgi:SepF-like predicted cell division protein (DUF552 family)
MAFDKIKKYLAGAEEGEESPEFIEIDLDQDKASSKVIVRTFVLKSYEDTTPILNALREGYCIAVIDIKHLKSKDVVELKRAISKIKKTVDALEGKIAGFGENTVIATPSRVFEIQKGEQSEEKPKTEFERF